MGGHGSGRRFWNAVKPDTDPLLLIDLRHLVRNDLLKAPIGESRDRQLEWLSRGRPAGSIMYRVTGNGDDWPHDITLIYSTRRSESQPWIEHRERIDLDTTPCHFGGERPWFLCPGCGKRKGVLRSIGGAFRCNTCHQIAHTSTRESVSERAIRRADKVRLRLGGDRGALWDVPPKPKGMHCLTYVQLTNRIHDSASIACAELQRFVNSVELWIDTVEKRP